MTGSCWNTEADLTAISQLVSFYDRVFAFGYDRMLRAAERDGLAARRNALLSQAQGSVLEIGAGTGLGLEHYTQKVKRLVLTEPSEPMARRLRERSGRIWPTAEVELAKAERLPFGDASFDCVVATLVLCTVPDPSAVLSEARRVLKPAGRLLFLEHVRSANPSQAKWQDRLERPWRLFGNGCRCNRDTERSIEQAGFAIEEIERGELPHSPPIVRPLVAGIASRND